MAETVEMKREEQQLYPKDWNVQYPLLDVNGERCAIEGCDAAVRIRVAFNVTHTQPGEGYAFVGLCEHHGIDHSEGLLEKAEVTILENEHEALDAREQDLDERERFLASQDARVRDYAKTVQDESTRAKEQLEEAKEKLKEAAEANSRVERALKQLDAVGYTLNDLEQILHTKRWFERMKKNARPVNLVAELAAQEEAERAMRESERSSKRDLSNEPGGLNHSLQRRRYR